jgi:hypothetical protein
MFGSRSGHDAGPVRSLAPSSPARGEADTTLAELEDAFPSRAAAGDRYGAHEMQQLDG